MKISRLILIFAILLTTFGSQAKSRERVRTPKKQNTTLNTYPDSLQSVWHYTEGLKALMIYRDSLKATEHFEQALQYDSLYAPVLYQMVANQLEKSPEEALKKSRKAWQSDSSNVWYQRNYGQALILNDRYSEATEIFRDLCRKDPNEIDNYRLTAILFGQQHNPYMALEVLDSAELRFGKNPYLSLLKRRLLLSTYQTEKAIQEARFLLESTPYEPQPHVDLANLYSVDKQDSMALLEYEAALKIDSTYLPALFSLIDFHAERNHEREMLGVEKRLFLAKNYPMQEKIKRFNRYTIDTRFYGNNYIQLNELAGILLILYPHQKEVVQLYAQHMIASGEIEKALQLYKSHLSIDEPEEEFYQAVIDIESYLQHPDSANYYLDKALQLFPKKSSFLVSKASSNAFLKKFDIAFKAYKEALLYAESDTLLSQIWGMMGDTFHLQAEDEQQRMKSPSLNRKWMKKCYKAYEKSLQYNPNNVLVLNNYAYFLSLDKEALDKALAMSTKVVELSDNNPTYLDTHAWVLFQLGRKDEALKVMRQAIALDGMQSGELLLHYGDILNELGQRFLAETYWRRALEKGVDAEKVTSRFEMPAPKKEDATPTNQ